ncbi:MAG: Tripartite DNA replication factor [Candelina submexicana]|nr:MAG: Tripartite DNA replication factor [Candelina submexicana]
MGAPPIAPSVQARSKLKAFRFVEDTGDATSKQAPVSIEEAGKENLIGLDEGQENTESLAPISKSPPRAPLDGPQTPVSRIPLVELIGNDENTANHPVNEDISPEERVCWQHTRSPNSSYPCSSMLTPAHRRGKKRARSSSPPSSAQELSKHFSKNKDDTLDLQDLQKLLKTPQADPALELWDRYSIDTSHKPKANGIAMPSFAHLLNASSPHSFANGVSPNSAGGLRRSLSCGTEWPTSKTKRRKITCSGSLGAGDDVLANAEDIRESHGKSKLSRVNLLVEKLQESLANPTPLDRTAGPSSSSPLPDRNAQFHAPSASPLQRLAEITEDYGSDFVDNAFEAQEESKNVDLPDDAAEAGPVDGKGSDFGDFDDDEFDAGMLEAADLAASNAVTSTSVNSKSAMLTHELLPSSPLSLQAQKKVMTSSDYVPFHEQEDSYKITSKPNMILDKDADEFGEEDDLFAADLEDIASKYDDGASAEPRTLGQAQVIESMPLPQVQGFARGVNQSRTHQEHSTAGRTDMGSEPLSDDEFGDDIDIDQLAAVADAASTQAFHSAPSQTSDRKLRAIKRYLIKQVVDGKYKTNKGQLRPEKVLLVQDEKNKSNKAITLRQSWFDSPCTPGSFIHLIGKFDAAGQCVVDDVRNMLILHPDHLISSLVVADSFGCTRRAVLQDRVKATSEASAPMLYGTALHEIFQEAMRANRWDAVWLKEIIQEVVSRHTENIYEIKMTVNGVIDYLMSKMPELQAWAELFVTTRPKPEAIVKDRNGTQAIMSVNKLLDVEEHVWSPMFGLKGNIDATVQVLMDDGDGNERTLTVPFEIKTGKNTKNASHRAQTALYTLLLSDRYDVEIAYGILYYMETSEISRIPAIRNELRHMVMQRNELACYVRNRLELPPMLKSPHLCGRCYAKVPCFIYHKLIDDGTGETSGLKEKFDEVVRHLKPEHAAFFRKWDDLLTKEEKEMLKFRRELWTMLSEEREKLGRCFGNVIIEPGSEYEAEEGWKINRFRYTLLKQKSRSGFSFAESQMTIGEPIVISDEKGHFALANGYITHVQKRRVTIAVDRRLHNARVKRPGFDSKTNQVFAGIMEVTEDGISQPMAADQPNEPVLYRLDKDEFSNGMATVRNNLIQVMAEGTIGLRETRKLVVEGVAPTFNETSTAYTIAGQGNLNADQKRAIDKVMSARDYALVLGMPGTGKTTTIAHIIRALVSQGKSVLLTSYTHTAVDNILLKIRHDNISILRLGAVAKVHPEVQEFAILAGIPKKTVEELHEAYTRPQVLATTCLGVNHPIFNERVFDYCIVDEASQITLPVCLGPIRMAKTFILVGDHYQLPPLVQNPEARDGGLDISLFKLLSDKHPSSVVNLEHQYRMCADIMTLSNELIYDGRLKCGTPTVASNALTIPNISALKSHHHTAQSLSSLYSTQKTVCLGSPNKGGCWLRDLLDPSVKACFINTDPLLPASREHAKGSRIVNNTEATLCAQLITSLLTTGVPATNIGVITLYRSQLALLKSTLRQYNPFAPEIEMHTADKFQGRDKEVVILSLVRSNEQKNVGELLRDWRRVNVAFTRARTKLLVLGSRETIMGDELLRRFVELVDSRGWAYELPKGASEGHLWEGLGATQVSEGGRGGSASPVKKGNGKAEKVGKGLNVGRLVEKRGVMRDIVNEAR